MSSAAIETGEPRTAEHVLRGGEADALLITEIARVMCIALDQGNGVVCIATAAHEQRLEEHLVYRGIDVSAARLNGQFVCLDAAECLHRILIGDRPDAARFANAIGTVVDRVASSHPRSWIYTEMAAVLSTTGDHSGAMAVEQLWSSFIVTLPTALYCAYPAYASESEADLVAFVAVCHTHCRVLHSETPLALEGRRRLDPALPFDAADRPGCAAGN